MTNYSVHNYSTGEVVGTVKMTADQYADYESSAQQPEGIIAAADVLSDEQIDLMGLTASTTVYID